MVKRGYLYGFAFLVMFLSITFMYQVVLKGDDGEDTYQENQLSDQEIFTLVYNTSYLGYHSTVWGSGSSVLGPSPDLEHPSIEGMQCPVYSYESVELSEEYLESMINIHFPEIELEEMAVRIDDAKSKGIPYLVVENETIEINLLRNRGIFYELKRGLLKESDDIGDIEEAKKIALAFLENHGGVPEDISDIGVTPSWTFWPNGSTFFGHYYVGIYRTVGEHEIRGHYMDNLMSFEIDASDREIVEFSWHWPEFDLATTIEEIPPLESSLDFYGMDSKDFDRANITSVELTYMLPYVIQPNGYAATADIYIVAPYWVVDSDDGKYYYLGLLIPDMVS